VVGCEFMRERHCACWLPPGLFLGRYHGRCGGRRRDRRGFVGRVDGMSVTEVESVTIGVVMGLVARSSDENLLAATRAGDAEAFGVFFARHSRTVLQFVRRRVGSAELAADLTAETFAAALIAVHRDHAREVPDGAAWLCGIARFKIIDSYREARLQDAARRQLRLERIVLEDEDVDAIDRLGGVGAPLHAALDRLSVEEIAAVVERVVLERDYSQIAHDTHNSQAAVRKRVSRGLARLRREMGVQAK
jgi:RNA polymerase sigma factor (sigma-70 family)